MPTKKKTKATAKATKTPAAPPDPREPLKPTSANLTATLKTLKTVLAGIPVPDPIVEEPTPEAMARVMEQMRRELESMQARSPEITHEIAVRHEIAPRSP